MTSPLIPTLADTPVLETERLILRAPQRGDYPAWAEFVSSDRARFIGGPLDAGPAWRAMGHLTGHWVHRGFGMFIFSRKSAPGTPIGMAGPWFPEGWPEQEIGWSLWSANAEGQGFAFEAVSAARNHAFTALNWPTAVSYISPGNRRSIALAERLGAVQDADAATPDNSDDLVYRHPAPGARA
jgi:RimJ/RimL family protein N-acetyltransferase